MSQNIKIRDIILVTDVGSTTSKAILIKKRSGEYRLAIRGEAPTTVEAPFEDVRVGVRNAIKQIMERTGLQLLTLDGNINKDLTTYLSTSSAGGGLQVMVSGVIRRMTAESGERAALGAGAIVLDVISVDDGRPLYAKIDRVRHLRPDMVLLVGGTDGGEEKDVIRSAEILTAAKPRPRFGIDFKLPVIFAGNIKCHDKMKETLTDDFAMKIVENVRPTLNIEIVEPARDAVHDLYLEHVMSHAPGYPDLMKWTDAPILPTPMGEGTIFRLIASTLGVNVVGVGLGGATTNIYSVYDGKFVRTVSANLGMSYSICNVLKETGIENIRRWIPVDITEEELRNELRNKMIRPTTIPPDLKSLVIEQAAAREALRLGFQAHKGLARPLRGTTSAKRDIKTAFRAEEAAETYINMLNLQLMGTTGGLLSHAPRRAQTSLIIIDGFQPEGVTKLIIDSIFMMPHLGVLSTINPEAAFNVLMKDCVVRAGTCIAPKGQLEEGKEAITISAIMPDGATLEKTLPFGSMELIPLKEDQTADVEIRPRGNLDVGLGMGKTVKAKVDGGVVGLIIDARGRPIVIPSEAEARRKKLVEWYTAIDAYPQEFLTK